MEKEVKVLLEWAEAHIKSRDAILRTVNSIEKDGNRIIVTHTDKKQLFIITPALSDLAGILEGCRDYGHPCLVTFNTEENLALLIKEWDLVKGFKRQFRILFVNPVANQYWSLFPATHDAISEGQGLKTGLHALSSGIPLVTPEDIQEMRNG